MANNKAGGLVENNAGTVTENSGTVTSNTGTVLVNEVGGIVTTNTGSSAKVETNNGTVTNNTDYARVETNNGTVTNNDTAFIDTNNGTVTNNNYFIADNYGTVTSHTGDGVIRTNHASGVVVTNNAGGTGAGVAGLNTNYGTVISNNNNGAILSNYGTVTDNKGTVTDNNSSGDKHGVIEKNSGTVVHNHSGATVNNAEAGEVGMNSGTVNNYGGTVTDNEGGTINQYWKVTVGGDALEGLDTLGLTAFDGAQWILEAAKNGTATFTPAGSYVFAEAPVIEGLGTLEASGDGYTLTAVGGNILLMVRLRYVAPSVPSAAPVSVTFIVSFDANGGSGDMDQLTVIKGGSCVLPECGFDAPDGMRFAGWAVGSPDGELLNPGDSCEISEATVIYAVWEKIA